MKDLRQVTFSSMEGQLSTSIIQSRLGWVLRSSHVFVAFNIFIKRAVVSLLMLKGWFQTDSTRANASSFCSKISKTILDVRFWTIFFKKSCLMCYKSWGNLRSPRVNKYITLHMTSLLCIISMIPFIPNSLRARTENSKTSRFSLNEFALAIDAI